jgi:menaquinone-dependent protoporphyrinogen oxidase
MARLLILYSSRYGQTEKIARHIAARLQARGHSVEAMSAGRASRDPSPSDYDAAIVGAPIYVGRFPADVQAWVRRWQPALAKRPTAFFAVSGSAASPDPAGRARASTLAERFLTQTGWRPALTASFAGAVPYTRYGVFTRMVMRVSSPSRPPGGGGT